MIIFILSFVDHKQKPRRKMVKAESLGFELFFTAISQKKGSREGKPFAEILRQLSRRRDFTILISDKRYQRTIFSPFSFPIQRMMINPTVELPLVETKRGKIWLIRRRVKKNIPKFFAL
jgi:hypothetical protein